MGRREDLILLVIIRRREVLRCTRYYIIAGSKLGGSVNQTQSADSKKDSNTLKTAI
jgi:hypothetical protein